jgi:hypothetical protein
MLGQDLSETIDFLLRTESPMSIHFAKLIIVLDTKLLKECSRYPHR